MKRFRIFISSVQKEFADERKALVEYIRNDVLLRDFFEVFIFEEVPANTNQPDKVYIEEVESSDIYIGLLGVDYGFENESGVSPTELEYNHAKNNDIQRWIYIEDVKVKRHSKEIAFIQKVELDVSRKKFSDITSLKVAVYRSAILYLRQAGKIDSYDFDSSLNHDATMKDINRALVREFVTIAKDRRGFPLNVTAPTKRILTHLKMFRNGGVTNSALLAFCSDPQKFFPTATIKCAHFHGVIVQKPIPDYKEFGGTIWQMAADAIDFVLSKISVSTGTRDKSTRVDVIYEIPRAVVAEAIINAVAHRDYYSKGSIQVSVFRNRIEIKNPGKLSSELNFADLKKPHSSYPSNPLLASCLFLTGEIERYGTGTLEILRLAKERGLKKPMFSMKDGFDVVIWRVMSVREYGYTGGYLQEQISGCNRLYDRNYAYAHETVHETVHETAHDNAHETAHETAHERREILVENLACRVVLVLDGEMSRIYLMQMLGLKHRQYFVKSYLNPAITEGLIERTIPKSPKSKKQKYRLTLKGKELKIRLQKDS